MRPIPRTISLALLAGALFLSACGRKEEEAPATNNLVEPPVENVIIDEPDAVQPANNAAAVPAPPPSVSEQQQMLDDAEASGMTARLPTDGAQTVDQANNAGE